MKKLVLILTLAAFACGPLVQTEAQAAPVAKVAAAKHAKKNHKKVNHKNKKGKKHKKG